MDRHRDRRAQARGLDRVERHLRLCAVRKGLGDHVIDAGVGGPCDLLFEHRPRGTHARRVIRIEHVGIADVAGEQRPRLRRDLLRDRERLPIDPLQIVLAPDDLQLLAVRVIRERLDDVRSGMDEIAMHLLDDLGMIEHRFGHEGAGLHVAAPFELEQIPLGADDRPFGQTLEQTLACFTIGRHVRLLAIRPTDSDCCSRRTSAPARTGRARTAAAPAPSRRAPDAARRASRRRSS